MENNSDINVWIENNRTQIEKLLHKKEYNTIFKIYYKAAGLSLEKSAKLFDCSRRSIGRYLSGKRKIQMSIVKKLLELTGITYTEQIDAFDNEINKNGAFIWYGNETMLFNALYIYRTKVWKISRFDMACALNIDIDILTEYENGSRKIVIPDIQKILETYHLKITDLFPALVSYDGGNTFLPLNIIANITIADEKYNLLDGNVYSSENSWIVNSHPQFPMQKYDKDRKLLKKDMPEELSIDEYINADELVFLKDDLTSFYEMDLSGKRLPPSYQFIVDIWNGEDKKERKWQGFVTNQAKNIKYIEEYKIEIIRRCGGGQNAIFDMKSYVFSDSPWYNMLKDKEYFESGRLTYIGDETPTNQCIVWPDGQYVRIIDLYREKYKYKYYCPVIGLASYGTYNNWIIYDEIVRKNKNINET